MPKGKILEIIRTERESAALSKGLLIKVEDEQGEHRYLALHQGWEVEFELNSKCPTRIESLTRVHEERLYTHSGPKGK